MACSTGCVRAATSRSLGEAVSAPQADSEKQLQAAQREVPGILRAIQSCGYELRLSGITAGRL